MTRFQLLNSVWPKHPMLEADTLSIELIFNPTFAF